MTGISSGSLQPTWFGHVATARDALILFEACLNGTLHHVPRRPHDRERSQLIKSGCVFIYEENASGIKRWTDGVPWSPSRILGNFLVYRELVKPFPPGEKKRAQKRAKNSRPTKAGDPYPRRGSAEETQSPLAVTKPDFTGDSRDSERALIGSLVDSYGFKEGGLVKKTMSVNLHGVHHHLVSYYSIEDVLEGNLQAPSKDPKLLDIQPRTELIAKQNFRAPLDDMDATMQDSIAYTPGAGYDYHTYGPFRSSPVVGQLGHSHQPSQVGINIYTNSAFSTAPQVQSGMQSYAPVTQSFYIGGAALPQPLMPKQEAYNPYTPGGPISINQDSSTTDSRAPPQAQPFPYRHDQASEMVSHLGSRNTSVSVSDAKTIDPPEWHRSSTGDGYSSISTPVSAHSTYAPPQSHWSMANSLSPQVTRSGETWGSNTVTSQWPNMNNAGVTQRPHLHMPSQSG